MNKIDKRQLKDLGLTNQEIETYSILLKHNDLSAQEIAQKLAIYPNTVYRTANTLMEFGLITILGKYPTLFRAISPQTSIPLLAERKIKKLQEITTDIGAVPLLQNSNISSTKVDLIYGQENIFNEGAKLLDQTKKEMLVISVGEPIPPELLLSVRNAIKRGVVIKMIVHKCDLDNKTVLDNLKNNGYKIKYYPGWGFHIAIYDKEKSLQIISNPKNSEERVATLTRSVGLSKALADYFNFIWQKAKNV
jgi:sugar-specific transcriptional regulator TrmB